MNTAHASSKEEIRSYLGIGARLAVLAAALGWTAWKILPNPRTESPGAHTAAPTARVETPIAVTPAPPVIIPDSAYQTRADWLDAAREEVEQARAERESAERWVADATRVLAAAQLENARLARESRGLVRGVRDATPRLQRADALIAAEREKKQQLDAEIAAIARAPKPRAKPLIDKSPVTRPPRAAEYHFELKNQRVSFIDMDELVERLKVDARIQIRTQSLPRPVSGEAGPVGEFSIRYKVVPVGLGLSSGYGSATMDAEYSLAGYEIVPMRAQRGEGIRAVLEPASSFGRAVNQLDPERDTITLWVYPDSFEVFRQVRDLLHARGFAVAARPLPEDMPIRGSPSGSISAAQ